MGNANKNKLFYFPFCQEGYWPTVYEAIESMRDMVRAGHGIEVYLSMQDAIDVAELTVFDDETWIVVEIEIDGEKSVARIAHDRGWADVQFDTDLIQHFKVQE